MKLTDRGRKMFKFGIVGFGLLIALAIFNPFVSIGPGERGVVLHFGQVQNEILDEGLHVVAPIMTTVKRMTTRVQKSDLKTQSSSKDLQLITAEVAVNWHITPGTINKIYQTVGEEDQILQRILTPAVSEVFKAASAKKTAEEIITKRLELTQEIEDTLKERMAKYDLIMDDISLVDVDFTQEFSRAVESKQIAEQEAKQAEYVALKAIQEAKAQVNAAKGEAESVLVKARAEAEAKKLVQTTLTDKLLQLEYLKRWDGQTPQVLVTGDKGGSPMMFNLSTPAPRNVKQEPQQEETTQEE